MVPLQRVDFFCAVGLWCQRSAYTIGARFRSGGVKRFWVHASACLSITVRRWDDSTQSIGAGFRWFLFHCMRIYGPIGESWAIFSGFWSYLSFGKHSPYITHASCQRAVRVSLGYRITTIHIKRVLWSVNCNCVVSWILTTQLQPSEQLPRMHIVKPLRGKALRAVS